jgi:hypothetical protein
MPCARTGCTAVDKVHSDQNGAFCPVVKAAGLDAGGR